MCMLCCCALVYLYNAKHQQVDTNTIVSARNQQEGTSRSVLETHVSSEVADLFKGGDLSREELSSEDLKDYVQTTERDWTDLENPPELMGTWREKDQDLWKQIQEQACENQD